MSLHSTHPPSLCTPEHHQSSLMVRVAEPAAYKMKRVRQEQSWTWGLSERDTALQTLVQQHLYKEPFLGTACAGTRAAGTPLEGGEVWGSKWSPSTARSLRSLPHRCFMLTVIHPALLAQFQVHKMADQRMDMFLSKQSSLDCVKKNPLLLRWYCIEFVIYT